MRHPLTWVNRSSREEVAAFQQTAAAKHLLAELWGMCDAMNLNRQCKKDDKVQNNFSKGWMHGHTCQIFLFSG